MKKYRAIPKSRITAYTGASYINDPRLISLCEDMTYQVYDNSAGEYKYNPDFNTNDLIDDAVNHVIFVISELDQENDPDERMYEQFLPYVNNRRFLSYVRKICKDYCMNELP
ncbi:MAG: hypothetical protein IJE78_04945 [Bacteroidaceae bacterium]|nr:hypothetical protein [Bacteroidaceae bacterium]